MGAKPVVPTLTSGVVNPSTLNSAFDILATAIASDLDRRGDSVGNNQMHGDLDMGGYTIKNVTGFDDVFELAATASTSADEAAASAALASGIAEDIEVANRIVVTTSEPQTAFVLAAEPNGSFFVYINGIYQNQTAYNIVGSTVTFTEEIPSGYTLEFIYGTPITLNPNRPITIVENLTALRASSISTTKPSIYLRGHTTAGDGGGGIFIRELDVVGAYVDNNGTIILPTGGDGGVAWIREFNGDVYPEWFGAIGDGTTDDTTSIQAAIDFVAGNGGGSVSLKNGRWLIDSANLTVKQGVALVGSWLNVGEISSRNYLSLPSTLVINPTYTVNLSEDFSAIKGLLVVRKGITIPTSIEAAATHVAAFSGTAITVGNGTSNKANDTYTGHCMVVGFDTAYSSDYNERPRIEYLSGDCVNGIYTNRAYDMVHTYACHFWPFTTTHQAWTFDGDAGWRREGAGYYFGTGVDWGQMDGCFCYGYDVGFDINGSDNVVLLNCGADGWKDNNTYSFGYKIRGTSKNTNLIGCKSAAKNTSVLIDLSGGGYSQCAKVTGGNLWAASTSTGVHIHVKNGNAIITGGVSMFDGPVGVKSDSTAGSINVTNCIFQTIGTPYSFSNSKKTVVFGNQFVDSVDSTTGLQHLFDNQLGRISYTAASDDVEGTDFAFNHSAGTIGTPTVSPDNAIAWRCRAAVYDGTQYGDIGSLRFSARGAPSAGSTAGGWIIATTPTGAIVPVDRFLVNEEGNLLPVTDAAYTVGSAALKLSSIYSNKVFSGAGVAHWTSGEGSPEGAVTAAIGSLYTRTNGGAGTTLYVKESGAGNTGWVAK